MPDKKLSRFEKKFKKARAKGKETFKYRKNRLDITKKRGVYSTKTADDERRDSNVGYTTTEAEKDKQTGTSKSPKEKMGPGYKHGGRVRNAFTEQYD